MMYHVLADVVMAVHFAFVAFVAAGALLLLWKRSLVWVHAPLVLYAAAIEFVGWTCPLTPLEQHLRRLAGSEGYEGGFLDQYLGGVLYPANWAQIHIWLGALLVAGNAILYWRVFARG